jgi:hypothetical protein
MEKQLIMLSGLLPSLDDLASAFFHITNLPGTLLQTLNGICAVAFLLKDANTTTSSKNLITTIQDLIKPSFEKLTENIESRLLEVSEGLQSTSDNLLARAKTTMDNIGSLAT